ncbi:MAG: hypothetical protein IAE80_12940 [Anaerolinea sp.]|nr:hypothetical protein [Anaerolinea sp.]
MHGLQAINYYMLVERDRWQGSPIARDNRLRPGYADFHIRLSRLIRETDLLNTTKTASVLVLYNYELGRWVEACTTLPYAFMGALSVRSSFKRRRIDCGFAHDPVVEAHVPERIVSPPLAARELYESTANIDRVQIFEVHALAAFSRAVERLNWRALPILEFYSALWTQADADPHGLCYFPPKPAAWNHLEVGQMHAWLCSIPDGMTLVLGIFEQGQAWASLILRVVAGSIRLITTFDTLERTGLDVQQMPTSPLDLEVICASVSEHIGHVAYGLVIERAAFFEWLQTENKPNTLNKSLMNGDARLYKGL